MDNKLLYNMIEKLIIKLILLAMLVLGMVDYAVVAPVLQAQEELLETQQTVSFRGCF